MKYIRPCKPPRRYVLVYYCPILKVVKPVPLKSVSYDVEIRGPVAEIRLTQEYLNTTHAPINVSYEFPRTDDSCFCKFEAIFEDRLVAGVIKEKEQAKAEFKHHQAMGSTVAYAEMKDQEEDIMKIELGNFPPNKPLTIIFTYVEPLDLIATQYWRLIIPSTLTPRYKMNEFAQKQ